MQMPRVALLARLTSLRSNARKPGMTNRNSKNDNATTGAVNSTMARTSRRFEYPTASSTTCHGPVPAKNVSAKYSSGPRASRSAPRRRSTAAPTACTIQNR